MHLSIPGYYRHEYTNTYHMPPNDFFIEVVEGGFLGGFVSIPTTNKINLTSTEFAKP